MPDSIEVDVLTQLTQRRLKHAFPDLDLTGLPPAFPFNDSDLSKFGNNTAIRACIREMAKRFDEIVHGQEPIKPHIDWKKRFHDLWRAQVATMKKAHGSDLHFSTTFIPELQNALDGWLRCLWQQGSPGAKEWEKVELVTDATKRQYGYLNVIRTDGPNNPGLGIAAWLGERAPRLHDLRQRLSFFQANPCPIRTLVLLRADRDEAITGASGEEINAAVANGRDVRVHPYKASHFHSLMAFTPWFQLVQPEVEAGGRHSREAFQEFLAELSEELLGWVKAWQQPQAFGKGPAA
jgi:hypothetical protein